MRKKAEPASLPNEQGTIRQAKGTASARRQTLWRL